MKNNRPASAQKREALINIIWCATCLALLIMLWMWKHSGDIATNDPQLRASSTSFGNVGTRKKLAGGSEFSNPVGFDIGADGIDDTVTAIVQCSTTRGDIVMDVRAGWSPVGAEQFLKLVDIGHFTDLPFTRVAPKYITQYGRKYIAPDSPDVGYLKRGGINMNLPDDPSLWGKRDMDFGYVFYAGSGKDSRYDEMVIALCPMHGCIQTGLGKAYWETPVATIRSQYYEVLRNIMSSGKPYPRLEMKGQHPQASGPDQGKLLSDPDYLKVHYPFIEYWKSCRVVERGVHQVRPVAIDHPDSSQRGQDRMKDNTAAALADTRAADPESGKPFIVEFNLVLNSAKPAEVSRVVLEIHPDWAPLGVEQFKQLLRVNYFNDARFFRVIPGFMAQFGIAANPQIGLSLKKKPIQDDANVASLSGGNIRGRISFATSGPNSRTTQMFINTGKNTFLDKQGFTPIGMVISGMEHIDAINSEYQEQPDQGQIQTNGNIYLNEQFPRLSYIKSAQILLN